MKRKRTVLFLLSVLLCMVIAGCDNSKSYDDSSKISSSADSWSVNNSNQSVSNGKYSGTMKLSGYGTVWTYTADKDEEITAEYKLNVKSGKAKFALITPDKNVSVLVENENKSSEGNLVVPVRKGKNRVKLVGLNKADVEAEFKTDKGELSEISFN